MKHLFFKMMLLFAFNFTQAQQTIIVKDNVEVKKSLKIADTKVFGISSDTTFNSKSSTKLITEEAAKKYADHLVSTTNTPLTTSLPLQTTANNITIPPADANNDGYLTAANYNKFNKVSNKIDSVTKFNDTVYTWINGVKKNCFITVSSQSVSTVYANITDFGAVSDNSTDCHAAIVAAIATGKAVFIPTGNFYLGSPIVLTDNQTIIGAGNASVVRVSSSGGFSIASHCTLKEFRIKGNGKSTGNSSENGIFTQANNSFWNNITNITFESLGNAGYYSVTNLYGQQPSLVANCNAIDCNYGYWVQVISEYVEFQGCTAHYCNTGMYIYATGNNKVTGGYFGHCNIGIYVKGAVGYNDGHSTINAVTSNHNTTNLMAENLENGYMFVGCNFLVGDITLINSAQIIIQNCRLSDGTLTAATLTKSSVQYNVFWKNLTINNTSGVGCIIANNIQ